METKKRRPALLRKISTAWPNMKKEMRLRSASVPLPRWEELYIETGLSEINMKNYHRILSLDSAMAVVQFDKDGTEYQRKYFISYPDSVMVMKFTANKKGKQNLVLSYCPNSEAESYLSADGNNGLGYTGCSITTK